MFLLPPIGFLMTLARFKQKRMMNERGYGYVFDGFICFYVDIYSLFFN
ncbi:MAG: hypothetical protein K6E21_06255 [Bacilli bacterium]|nr:hypothetical protein [Bacilli bacterium]